MKKFLLFIPIIQNCAFATETLYQGNEEIKNVLNSNVYTPNYFTMFLGLFIVILLIYLTGIIYQKLIKVKLSTGISDDYKIDILSTSTLGQGKNLHVIKVGDKTMLIGATQTNITYLNTIQNEIVTTEKNNDK